MLEAITPVLLTLNEAANISRTLEALRWAREIVVVDSHSTDETPVIVRGFPNARLLERRFDTHAQQWSFAIHDTGVRTEWVLALDADYLLTAPLLEELRSLRPADDVDGFSASFIYCVNGRPLRAGLYPPVTVLYRPARAHYVQDGHTQRVVLPGRIAPLRSRLLHDDRKPLAQWLEGQDRYMRLEASKLAAAPWSRLGLADRMRSLALPAPFLVFFWVLLIKGGLFDGRAGVFYAWQRALAEALLALRLVELRLAPPGS
jgi:glycosyltransferase involved in cell wall biosynthesis